MLRISLVSFVLSIAIVGHGNAQAIRDLSDPAIGARWLVLPSADDIENVYPKQASRKHLNGKVVLTCAIAAGGRLADCSVMSEVPAGNGFGEAALRLTPRFKMQERLSDGSPTEGGSITIPLTFREN
jgi:periplasmic protein TonB